MRIAVNIYIVSTTIIILLISIVALTGLIPKEFYLACTEMLVFLSIINYMKRSYSNVIFLLSMVYFIESISWYVVGNLSTLPRDDVYYYYPFTKYIYINGKFTSNNVDLEKVYLNHIAPWPSWHIIVVSLSLILGLSLLRTYMIAQLLTTVILTVILSLVFLHIYLKALKNEYSNSDTYIIYSLPFIVIFSSLYTYVNTNPVSRSYATIIYLLMLVLLLNTLVIRRITRYDIILMLMLVLASTWAHPFYSIAIPMLLILFIMFFVLMELFFYRHNSILTYIKHNICSLYLTIGIFGITSSITWIMNYTHTARNSIADAFKILIDASIRDIFGRRLTSTWLTSASLQRYFFKVHFLEPYIEKLVWITDLLPIVITFIGIILSPYLIKRKKDMIFLQIFALLLSITTVLIFTGILSQGIITRYTFQLVYVIVVLFFFYIIHKFVSLSNKLKTIISIVTIILLIIYPTASVLSLGSRTYQAAFIWSSKITLVDKGMHTDKAEPIMNFFIRYINLGTNYFVYADDDIVRIYFTPKQYIELTIIEGESPPKPLILFPILHKDEEKVIIIEVRNLKPTYWQLVGLFRYNVKNPTEMYRELLNVVKNKTYIIYNNGFSKIRVYA